LQLARDVDIVLLDATQPFGDGHLLPAGRLREPLPALERADMIVISRGIHSPVIEAVVRRYTGVPIFYSQTELLGLGTYASPTESPNRAEFMNKRYFAFCGIGNPPAFFEDLKRWHISVIGQSVFRDHHTYTQRDISHLESEAAAKGSDALLCTEKDIYDLMPLQPQRMQIVFCKIGLRFDDEERLWRAILQVMEQKRGKVPS
jgi:tetraacyldisaccharide 4'-kinase